MTEPVEDLVAWFTQIWDEEERLAIKAGGDRWILDGGIHRESHPSDEVVDWVYDEADEHIAYHDPASVLARIAADRAILDEHPNVNDGDCGTCVTGKWGYPTHGGATPQPWPCRTIRLKAEQYADREGFRPEWLVERQGVER